MRDLYREESGGALFTDWVDRRVESGGFQGLGMGVTTFEGEEVILSAASFPHTSFTLL